MQFQPGASLILGGARSGKSKFAEDLAHLSQRQKIYLATSEIYDGEMQQRVALHQSRRGADWQLVEEPLELGAVVKSKANGSTCLLVDCLTLWLTNLMMADKDVPKECELLCDAARSLSPDCSVMFVSNEVGQGIVPMEKMARDFRDYAGTLHQQLAVIVPHVWFITAGLPQKLK